MATYFELATLTEEADWDAFLQKVLVATAIKATAIINAAAPSPEALAWARDAIGRPRAAGEDLVWYVVASNETASVAQILAATDSAIQTNIDAAVDALYP